MNENIQRPAVMRNALEDLTGSVEGRFSPEDWQQILNRAEVVWRAWLASHLGASDAEAWSEVVREFYASRYWGFTPNYKAPKVKKPRNLGATFIWMAFNSLVTFKVAVLWFGQVYTRSDDPKDKWIFFSLLFLIVFNFVYFLWKNHAHPE